MNKKYLKYKDEYLNFNIEYKQLKTNNMKEKHFHDSYEIYYLVEGSRIFLIENKILTVLPGSLVVISPHITHQVLNATESKYESFIVSFTLNAIPANRQYKFKKTTSFIRDKYSVISLSKNEQKECLTYAKKVSAEIINQNTGFELALYGIFLQIISFCQRSFDAQGLQTQSQNTLMPTRINSVIQYINENYSKDLNLTRLSETFFVSPAYLSRSFKKETGVSLIDYINSVRIQKAIAMLVSSQSSVVAVAKKSGFSSTQNFNRVFKQITGKSPSFYKKLYKQTTKLK